MLFALKAAALVLIELNLFFFLGVSFAGIFKLRGLNAGARMAGGFALYHGLFWIFCYPWGLADLPFHILAYAWAGLLVLFVVLSFTLAGKTIVSAYAGYFRAAFRYFFYIIPCLGFLLVIVFIATRNGFLDIDSQTYIAEVTTILGTNHISAFEPVTGLPLSRYYFLKRGCSMFGAESAFWCRLTGMHPLLYCRYIRTALNPLLLGSGVYGLAREVTAHVDQKKAGDSRKQAFLYLMLSCPAMLLFDNSGFTNTRFLMHRTYEGKAYLGGTLLFFTVLLCIAYIRTESRAAFALLFINELATLSVSATALYLIPPLVAAVMAAFAFGKRKWRLIPLLLLLIVPNIAFAILQAVG